MWMTTNELAETIWSLVQDLIPRERRPKISQSKCKRELPGRKEPYSEAGIRRLKCVRCGKKSVHQWRVCADGLWRPICRRCDILLNHLTLQFMFPGDAVGNSEKIQRYIKSGS